MKIYLLVTSLLMLLLIGQAQDHSRNDNIALGKTVIFDTSPNYALCKDPDDNKQLTDGIYSSQGKLQEVQKTNSLWVQKGTVGWTNIKPIVITIDLGSVQPFPAHLIALPPNHLT